MKMIVTILSAIGLGLMVAFNDYSPIAELHGILANKRRFMTSMAFSMAAFVFLMAAIVTGVIEGSLQYEVQGFLLWSSLFSAAAIFFGLAVVSGLIGQVLRPRPTTPALSLAKLEEKFQITELIETWLKNTQATAQAAAEAATTPEPRPERERPTHYSPETFPGTSAHH